MEDIETSSGKNEVKLEHHEATEYHPHTLAVIIALHHDAVAPETIGGLYEEMPEGYYWTKDFLGTLIVSSPHYLLIVSILNIPSNLFSTNQ
jgi:hypothetical protein